MPTIFKKSKEFWSWVNSSKGRHNPIPTLTHDSGSTVDDLGKAEIFNHHFHSVFMQEDLSSFDSLKQSLPCHSPIISTVKFLPSTVCSYLCNLDVSKACGPDLIPAFLLKSNAEAIASPLCYLFNKSKAQVHYLETGSALM